MSLIWMAIAGLLVGVVAKIVKPGKDPGGMLATMLFGVVGTFVGNIIRTTLGGHDIGAFSIFSLWDWLYSVLGAVIVIYIWQKFIAPKLGDKNA